MQTLRTKIGELRIPVAEEPKHFIPHDQLLLLLEPLAIRKALQEGAFDKCHDLDSIAKQIHRSARRIFAVLIVLRCDANEILQFLENDHLQESPLDHKLPFSLGDLKAIVPSIANDFFEKQWEYCAPVFFRGTDHRNLHTYTALPFVENRKLARGGFGEVFKVVIHPGHQRIDVGENRALVRKEFPKIQDAEDKSHEQELYNLCLLNQLKHPQILELVSFYTYQNRRNFLFPLANGGNMDEMFSKSSRPKGLESDFDFFKALSRLSSALESLHRYTSERNLDLQLIGLHRDLKPSNILVHGGHFILADFGLSRFRSDEDSSKTPFTGGGGDFLAPECEDLERDFTKGIVGRASDIWSFGCILTEVLVYMASGKDGLKNFRETRTVKVSGWTIRTFHAPGPKLNEHVARILSSLGTDPTVPVRMLIHLVRNMLRVEQEFRPQAGEVSTRLEYIAIVERLIPVDQWFEKTINTIVSAQASLQYERFQSWKHALQCHMEANCKRLQNSEQTFILLDRLESELRSILARYELATHPLFAALRQINDSLWDLMPEDLQASALMHLEHRLLEEKNDVLVESAQKDLIWNTEYPLGGAFQSRLGNTLFIRHMVRKADEASANLLRDRIAQGKSNLCIDPESVVYNEPFYENHFGRITGDHRVYIEWILYDTHWEGDVQTEMITRVGNIAVFMHEAAERASLSKTLPCRGFFHAPVRHAFGLVYDIPDVGHNQLPQSLYQTIHDTKIAAETSGRTSGLPDLGQRFELARILARNVLELHRATLLHRNISSLNVLFFVDKSAPSILSPYLIGFNHIRPNDLKSFTDGPPPNSDARRYHHPDYSIDAMRQGQRFRPVFDYYSLGLVLLEIGLWDTIVLSPKLKKLKAAPDLKQKLIKSRLPLLGFATGGAYRDVVAACLNSAFERDKKADSDIVGEFELLVVEPLRQLKA